MALAADPRIAEDVRQALIGTARDWTRRAEQAEAATHALPPWLGAEALQPVMQQQQQEQRKIDKPDGD
jgi:hypothetical protein